MVRSSGMGQWLHTKELELRTCQPGWLLARMQCHTQWVWPRYFSNLPLYMHALAPHAHSAMLTNMVVPAVHMLAGDVFCVRAQCSVCVGCLSCECR